MSFLAALHPEIVHFPIALFVVYVLFEALGTVTKKDVYSKAAQIILVLGVLGAFFAVLTGNQAFTAYQNWDETTKALFNEHRTFANITVWYFTILLVFGTYMIIKKKFSPVYKYLILLCAVIGIIFVYETAEYGGQLVYKYGIGIEKTINNTTNVKP